MSGIWEGTFTQFFFIFHFFSFSTSFFFYLKVWGEGGSLPLCPFPKYASALVHYEVGSKKYWVTALLYATIPLSLATNERRDENNITKGSLNVLEHKLSVPPQNISIFQPHNTPGAFYKKWTIISLLTFTHPYYTYIFSSPYLNKNIFLIEGLNVWIRKILWSYIS